MVDCLRTLGVWIREARQRINESIKDPVEVQLNRDIDASRLRLRQFGLGRNRAGHRIVERHENDFIHSIVACA